MPISTRIFENGTALLRCLSGVSRALFCHSETISKVGNINILSARSPFFFSPLSPPFSFLSRVVSRLTGVKKTQFRCRSGENGQIFRSHLLKNPGRCCKQMLPDGEKWANVKILTARSPFFFYPLSPPFSFLSRVVSRHHLSQTNSVSVSFR